MEHSFCFLSVGRNQCEWGVDHFLEVDSRLNMRQVLIADAERFPNVGRHAACREHCGSHEYIWEIITTTQEPNGKLTLQSVYEELKDQIDTFMTEPTDIKVVFQCSWGKHRSVACAEITSEMLRTRGLCDNPPHHLCQWYWSKYKCGRLHCHCMEITRKKRCAIETARACWEAVFGELPPYNM